jgi:hypothetical protein
VGSNINNESSAQTQADRQQYDPTSGMSGVDKFLSGAGKSVADMGLGIRQLTGFADQKEVDERKALDRPLMDTGAGVLGGRCWKRRHGA